MTLRRAQRATRCLEFLLLWAVPGAVLVAQQPPAPPAGGTQMPRPEQLEPGVDTSHTTLGNSAATPAPAASSAPAAPRTGAAPAAATAVPASAAPASGGAARGTAPAASAPGAHTAHKGPDRLELEATDITGNRELPKVLYIVPWKHSDLGDLVGKPTNSLLDEVLQPLDRDVFQRENRYYDALKPDAAGPRAGAAPHSGDKP
jgi:hypothetical protein